MKLSHLPPEGGRVLCACSGGADSTALLHLLVEQPGLEVVCAHFNHSLRGEESERDARFVGDLCRALHVPFYMETADVGAEAKAWGKGIEETARALRYRFLERTAEMAGCAWIATAHTADDNAETVLLHLLRGTGPRGLSGIPPVRGNLIRPLLEVRKAEIVEWLRARGYAYVEDSSNKDRTYTRNRLRLDVLPLLRELNPGAVAHICAAAALSRADEAYLNGLAEAFYPGAPSVPVPALLELPSVVAFRVLRNRCPGAARGQLEAVYQMCLSPAVHGRVSMPGGGAVVRDRDQLWLAGLPETGSMPRRALPEGETVFFPESGRLLCREAPHLFEEIHNSFNTFYFKNEKISGKIYAGSREPGDRIRLAGRNCTKTLKKLFSEAGLPLGERSRRVVLRDADGVIAVEGFGSAERCAAAPGELAVRVSIR